MSLFQHIQFKKHKKKNKKKKKIKKKKKSCPNFVELCIKSFFDNLYTSNVISQNVPKMNFFVKLPFLRSSSFQIQKKYQKSVSEK